MAARLTALDVRLNAVLPILATKLDVAAVDASIAALRSDTNLQMQPAGASQSAPASSAPARPPSAPGK